MKKVIVAVCALLIVAGSTFGVYRYKHSGDDTERLTKEVSVAFGNVTAGVTESAAVSVESLSQTYDLKLDSVSVSASVESGSTSSSSASSSPSGSGMNTMGMGGMGGGMNMGGMSAGSTNVTTSSDSSSVKLVVDEVKITEGQTVAKGDVIMTLTAESIADARAELEQSVSDAELALKQAQIDKSDALLSAKYEYDTRIAEGKAASATYQAALDKITSNIATLTSEISDLQAQIAACTDDKQLTQLQTQLKSDQSQLSSAKSSQSADELAAKLTYEETVMYYQNAQSLYDIAVNDVDTDTQEAQDKVDTAKENLESFEAYVSGDGITAAYSGTITGVGYASGDVLTSDTAIASYANAETITVTVNVTEDDIASVHQEDTVEISFLSYPDKTFDGYVSEIGSSTSETGSSTVSYLVTVVITSFPDTLLSGMTANVTFITKQVRDVLYVSAKAVTMDGANAYVLKKNADNSLERIQVQTGFSDGTYAEISGDLAEGDILLIESKVG